MTQREILVEARGLIATKEQWCQGWFTDRKGRHCATGALLQAGPEGDLGFVEARDHLSKLAGESLVAFNDSHTHAEVLALLDRGIEAVA